MLAAMLCVMDDLSAETRHGICLKKEDVSAGDVEVRR